MSKLHVFLQCNWSHNEAQREDSRKTLETTTYIFIGIKLKKQQHKLMRIKTHYREIPLHTTTDKTEFI